MTTVINKVTSI